MKAASQFAAFTAGSLASFGVDWSVFSVLWWTLPEDCRARLFVSVAVARCLSLVFNFACNRFLVFRSGANPSRPEKAVASQPPNVETRTGTGLSFARYLFLAAVILAASWVVLKALHAVAPRFPLSLAKPAVDFALFLLSFYVQKRFVFAK